MHIKFQKNGVTKEIKVGFSYTTFFFGWLALAVRGTVVPMLVTLMTFGLAGPFFYAFTINRIHARQLASDGWVIADQDKSYAFMKWGIK